MIYALHRCLLSLPFSPFASTFIHPSSNSKNLTTIFTDIETAGAKAKDAMSTTTVETKSIDLASIELLNELIDKAKRDAQAMGVRIDTLGEAAAEIRSMIDNARGNVRHINNKLSRARTEAGKAKYGAYLGAVSLYGLFYT
jgi:wobble nucleotide-excising tRNase